MATQVRRHRGTSTNHSTYAGLDGEITVDTTRRGLVVHDGVTPGGHPTPTSAEVELVTSRMEAQTLRKQQINAFRRYRMPPCSVVGTFEPNEAWERISGTGAGDLVADTEHFRYGTQGIKITSTDATTTYAQRSGLTLDLSNATHIQFELYTQTPQLFDTVSVFMYTGDGDDYFITYATLAELVYKPLRDGWRTVKLLKADFTANGSPSWANITKVLLQVHSTATASITFDQMLAFGASTEQGIVTFRFDDCFADIMTAKATLDKYHMRGVAAAITRKIGTSGYASKQQLLGLYEAGWDIANHTCDTASLVDATAA